MTEPCVGCVWVDELEQTRRELEMLRTLKSDQVEYLLKSLESLRRQNERLKKRRLATIAEQQSSP